VSQPDPYYIHTVELVGDFKTPTWVNRHPENPILTKKDIPYPSHLVFNCSVIEEDDGFLMIYRSEVFPNEGTPGGAHTDIGLARSDDGVKWTLEGEPLDIAKQNGLGRVYDPRMVKLDAGYCLTCCAPGPKGPRAATFLSDDLRTWRLVDLSLPASRNTLLFPEKIGGQYWRLERPFWEGPDGYAYNYGKWFGPTFDTWISHSPDLEHWGGQTHLIDTKQVPYANIKIGPGATPIRTDAGWLLLIHGVDLDPSRGKNGWEDRWPQRYHGGVALLDLDDPTKLIGLGRAPFLTPEAEYEVSGGYRNNVVFPMTGLVRDNRDVWIYYGASDAFICLAVAPLDELLKMCEPV
jgi:beta-1,4-mannooligosaccharide/beta-1,4-mannosyl-N-acetylglucosamine phosphorylase